MFENLRFAGILRRSLSAAAAAALTLAPTRCETPPQNALLAADQRFQNML